jgi:hypothetical protein
MAKEKLKNDFIEVKLAVILFQEAGQYVSYCPALELSSYGDDEQEAKEAFEDALNIFIEETTRKGTLERELLKLGWRLQQHPKPSYKPPTLSSFRDKDGGLMKRNRARKYDEKVELPFVN